MRDLLEKLSRGELSVEDAEKLLRPRVLAVSDIACLDLNRKARTGIPEIVLAEGKTPGQVISIVDAVAGEGHRVVVSRLPEDVGRRLGEMMAQKHPGAGLSYDPLSRTGVYGGEKPEPGEGRVAIITAGTSDIAVAEEARIVAEEMGARVYTQYDVGVAGVHRLNGCLETLASEEVSVCVVAAGREGALPTLVAGLVDAMVIGLPVSVGYGFGRGGEAALMAMLQSCSPLLVVNIDAGIVAGACAARLATMIAAGGRRDERD